jgi:hypothetical protein
MKKLIYLFSITFLLLQSCSSDSSENIETPKKVDVLDSDFTLRYEIKFSSPTSNNSAVSNLIYYWTEDVNQNKQVEVLENIPPSTSVWSKTINAKLKKVRPYKMGFRASSLIRITGYGNATCNIYVNDHLVLSETTNNANAYRDIPVNIQTSVHSMYFN